ncbi:MAG: uncharacterized protein QOE36_444 [Gaiellaceae bacterium]|jgi:uncharacterized protein YggE|nr:uncharacterized protein [Gaiellaceae bacterium]
MKIVRVVSLAAAVLAAVALAGFLQPQGASGSAADAPVADTITVSGTGSVSLKPDRADFQFGVITQGATAAAALEANAQLADRVIAALEATGVAHNDLQTAGISISPNTSAKGAISGYTASNSVAAKLRHLDKVGAVIDAAVAAGANEIYGPSLTVDDQASAYRDALKAAVADARPKAETLATAAGRPLGRILSITEAGASPVPMAATDSASQKAGGTPFVPGTQEISATVNVTFATG